MSLRLSLAGHKMHVSCVVRSFPGVVSVASSYRGYYHEAPTHSEILAGKLETMKKRLAFVSIAYEVVTLQRLADFSMSEETEGRKGSSGTDTRCRADCKNALDFYIISRSSLGFNAKFQLARSSTRLNSCTSSQSSPNSSSAIRTALACSMLRCPTLDATTSKCIVSNRCSRNCSTPNLKIVSGQGGSLHRTFYVIPGVAPPGGAELGPMELVLEVGKIWLPNVGASVSLALDERWRWE